MACVAVAGVVLAGCGAPEEPASPEPVALTQVSTTAASAPPTPSAVPEPTSAPPPAPATTTQATPATSAAKPQDCPVPKSGFDCDFQRRFAAAQAYVANRPGTVGIVVRDRQTGAVWRNDHAGDLTWTASTIKLAMVVDLLRRDRAGAITLTGGDRAQITAMLHRSDDDAATALWSKYGGADHTAFNQAFPGYGMTSLHPERGFSKVYPYWGFQKCTPDDLDRLINYVLDKVPADDKRYILDNMRTVAPNQQWGVWGAGPAARPGNKDGWSEEEGGWVMNSVGFVGPGERYTLAIMNNLRGQGGYDEGQQTDTEVARLIFAGRF
ncbi:beta-lactamase class A [Actinokineospora auranticolor]|uniref:Beta-lactamase class A n=1 Tax=Actinokineospora auranticolor TaxID=155976 RepID=A0A2S6GG82_9PSEU|nr:beta-lactamase class A [Actinokineospora auranticolor]